MKKKSLDDILRGDDPYGLLKVKPPPSPTSSDEARVVEQFCEVNEFIEKHHREPGAEPDGSASLQEMQMEQRLAALRASTRYRDLLSPIDRHSLLSAAVTREPMPQSLADILSSQSPLLSSAADDIFILKHVQSPATAPDRIAERKPCPDFAMFRPLFEAVHADIATGRRQVLPYARDQVIKAGQFFILGGLLAFVAEIKDMQIRGGKPNARLRVVFENGTEGDHLMQSLARQLYGDRRGQRITDIRSGPLFEHQPLDSKPLSKHDRVVGYVYIATSLSTHPEIVRLRGSLFKIGFTTGDVQRRISNAENDPTFLLAQAHLVRTYTAVNLDPNKTENLLHRFFAEACLNIELVDRFGKPFRPREWFLVQLPVIEQVIPMLLDGTLLKYRYDVANGDIVPRSST